MFFGALLSLFFPILSPSKNTLNDICRFIFYSYSFSTSDRHLGYVIIVSTPKFLLTVDLHFTAISNALKLSLPSSFFSHRTECSINSELFLNLWSGTTFVLMISFIVENNTCSQCKRKSIRGIQRR